MSMQQTPAPQPPGTGHGSQADVTQVLQPIMSQVQQQIEQIMRFAASAGVQARPPCPEISGFGARLRPPMSATVRPG